MRDESHGNTGGWIKALYIRLVLFLIGSAVRQEIARQVGPPTNSEDFGKELSRYVDSRIDRQSKKYHSRSDI
jgi:hypothetical protein